MSDLFSAVRVSLLVSSSATVLCAVVGVPLGALLALREFRGKGAVVTVLNMLLAVPTVVVGLLVYAMICRGSVLGRYQLLFTPGAIVLGQFVLALPIMVAFCHSAVAGVEHGARDTAVTLGAGGPLLVWTLLSEARFGVLAAVAAAFGRVIGEVGVSMMLGGNIAGYTRTMTTTIALETSKGEFGLGIRLGVILLLIALGVNALLRFLQGKAGN
jgi:tungstate transport system permease protein